MLKVMFYILHDTINALKKFLKRRSPTAVENYFLWWTWSSPWVLQSDCQVRRLRWTFQFMRTTQGRWFSPRLCRLSLLLGANGMRAKPSGSAKRSTSVRSSYSRSRRRSNLVTSSRNLFQRLLLNIFGRRWWVGDTSQIVAGSLKLFQLAREGVLREILLGLSKYGL